MSWLSRSYGLSIDSLLSVSLVLSNGSFITVGTNSSSLSEQQLFWALRGGGKIINIKKYIQIIKFIFNIFI